MYLNRNCSRQEPHETLTVQIIKYTLPAENHITGSRNPSTTSTATTFEDVERLHQQHVLTDFTFKEYETLNDSIFPVSVLKAYYYTIFSLADFETNIIQRNSRLKFFELSFDACKAVIVLSLKHCKNSSLPPCLTLLIGIIHTI